MKCNCWTIKSNYTTYIILISHSLGGGLSTYMGIKYQTESLFVSEPGITPLEYEFMNNLIF